MHTVHDFGDFTMAKECVPLPHSRSETVNDFRRWCFREDSRPRVWVPQASNYVLIKGTKESFLAPLAMYGHRKDGRLGTTGRSSPGLGHADL